ncbi:Memo family protein, partial [Toxoplasma gondii p89]
TYFAAPPCVDLFSPFPRFRYSYLPPATASLPIFERIGILDKEGAALIEQQDPAGFQEYYERTGNTICGHNPISIFLHLLEASGRSRSAFKTKLLDYSQVENESSSSVSYAAFASSLLSPAPSLS